MNIDIAYIAIVLGVILLSMTLHEAMHAFAGYWLGDNTAKNEGRLTLNPLKHIDPFLTILLPLFLALIGAPIFGGAKPVPFNPYGVRYGEYGAALVGLAGPLTNLILSFIVFAVYALSGAPQNIFGDALQVAVVVNLGFFIFNMIPIPPLDGSRVLYALAPDGVRSFMEFIENYGVVLVFAVVMVGSQYIGQYIVTVEQIILRFYGAIFGVQVV